MSAIYLEGKHGIRTAMSEKEALAHEADGYVRVDLRARLDEAEAEKEAEKAAKKAPPGKSPKKSPGKKSGKKGAKK